MVDVLSSHRVRYHTAIAVWIVIFVGLSAKFYTGSAREFVNDWGPASVAYELFFMLLAFFWVPRSSAILPIAVTVCLMTCCVECFQLWQPPWLQALRSTVGGKILLGHQFSWWDFPAYPIGCACGWLLLHWIVRDRERASR